MFKRIDHIEIVPADAEKSIAFYTDVLGFEVRLAINVNMGPLEKVIYLRLGDTVLELLSAKDPQPPSRADWQVGYRMMALEVADVNQALAHLEERGVEPTWGPVDLGSTKRAEIKDPDGLSIELREWPQAVAKPAK